MAKKQTNKKRNFKKRFPKYLNKAQYPIKHRCATCNTELDSGYITDVESEKEYCDMNCYKGRDKANG